MAVYLPSHFREERIDVLHAFIDRHPLGVLVAASHGALSADHLPMLLVREQGAKGALHGHVARANPLWRTQAPASEVLVIFQGADAYVSPSWYPSKTEHGKVVPTWNYAVVHAHGRIRWFDDRTRLHALVSSLTTLHERARPEPWAVADAPGPYIEAMLKAIVGFEIEITDLVGKFKASQNRSDADRAGVRDALRSSDTQGLDELVRPPADPRSP